MPRLTDAEYDTLDEEITRNPPDVDPDGARRPVRMVVVDDISVDWGILAAMPLPVFNTDSARLLAIRGIKAIDIRDAK
jgi:hypothetical protein